MKKIALLVVAAAVLLWWRYRPFRVEIDGSSMEPELHDGDWCLAMAFGREGPRAGDVVVLEHPERPSFELVKRIHDVVDGEAFVTGDNVEASNDSREFGPVALRLLKGRVVAVYQPSPRLISSLPRDDQEVFCG